MLLVVGLASSSMPVAPEVTAEEAVRWVIVPLPILKSRVSPLEVVIVPLPPTLVRTPTVWLPVRLIVPATVRLPATFPRDEVEDEDGELPALTSKAPASIVVPP